MGSNILLSIVVQQLVAILVFLQEKILIQVSFKSLCLVYNSKVSVSPLAVMLLKTEMVKS